ncbi:MAG: response regulator transcription factor [Candidatus Omnitrophica bacterium]|nr:response regulator transcription factor [Candidatus Omnitrophota bacterium]MDD5672486.1 response regulator transcription factor [Candidatus Omnitrophota bacterium]
MSKENILVIEDEKNIVELVKYNLEQEGFAVRTSLRGDAGLEEARRARPDLVILDLMLPGMDGLEICRALKQNEKTAHIPIIMLTAKSEETDQIVGFELGADDYVTKPFSPRQLVARVKAVLRRVHEKPKEKIFRVGVLEMDTGKYLVTLKGKAVELSSKEFELLKALLEANGRVLSREYLLENVWGYDRSVEIETRTVDMHIGQLRKKIKAEAHRVITVKNVGYRMDVDS